MVVYRVEHKKDRYGPYCQKGKKGTKRAKLRELIDNEHSGCAKHPVQVKYGYLSGFSNLEDLYTWFDGWIQQLGESGFIIRVYNCEIALDFGNQVLFIKKGRSIRHLTLV